MKQIKYFDTGNMNNKNLLFLVFVYLSVFFVNIASSQDSLNITPANPIQGEPSVYTLNFVCTDTLYPDAIIEVNLTDDFDLSNLRIANSTSINGGFNVSVNGNLVVLKRKGNGRIVNPKEKVDVQFGLLLNPLKTQVEFPMKFTIKNSSKIEKQKIEQIKVLFSEKKIKNK